MREMICVICPNSCPIQIHPNGTVSGGLCERGKKYVQKELTNPERTLTATIALQGCAYTRLSVKTSQPIPKALLLPAMSVLKTLCVSPPIHVGDILVKNFMDTQTDLVATKSIC